MKRKIALRMCLLALFTCFLTFVVTFTVNYQVAYKRMQTETARQTALVAAGLEQIKFLPAAVTRNYLAAAGKSDRSRVTLIAADGKVIFDSNYSTRKMENHFSRPEVQAALRSGTGAAVRVSHTLGSGTFYAAEQLSTGEVVRLANTTNMVGGDFQSVLPLLVLLVLCTCMLCVWLAARLTKQLVEPISKFSLDQLMENNVYEELSPFLGKIRTQDEQIQQQLALLNRQQVEFEAIVDNMSEGLVVLDHGLRIVSANHAAVELLAAGEHNWRGESLIAFSRDAKLQRKARKAAAGKKASFAYEGRGGKHLQLFFSPVEADGVPHGCVLLIVDVSERYAAERSRREFTANVSHELKTPLTSISGYAEMISLGFAKAEDVQSFAEKIHTEAAHLITLVEDIIKLSRLDESTPLALPFEPLELSQLVSETVERLRANAERHQMEIEVSGTPVIVRGVRQMMAEAVFNLCENAIKYGRAGGKVRVLVSQTPLGAQVSVEDNGIGIAPEDQERIFERFYRADKSHSRTVDGTGLGLAIVKHICEIHGGSVRVESAAKQGSIFTLTFPQAEI